MEFRYKFNKPPTLHPNFKSLDPNFTDIETIYNYLRYPFIFQSDFLKKTTPSEKKMWRERKLQSFKIILEKIDRLYYINVNIDDFNQEITYHLLARQNKGYKKLYIEMRCVVCNKGDEYNSKGLIFISFNLNIFMQIISRNLATEIKTLIYRFIEEDGDYSFHFNDDEAVPLLLKNLCQETIYKYVDRKHWDLLPKKLKNDIGQFSKYQDAINDYDMHTSIINHTPFGWMDG